MQALLAGGHVPSFATNTDPARHYCKGQLLRQGSTAQVIYSRATDLARRQPQLCQATEQASAVLETPSPEEREPRTPPTTDQISSGTWKWGDWNIRYQHCGSTGPPVLLVHGFGANCDHFRKNTPVLGKTSRAFAIDLLGYGYSDKPDPRSHPQNSIYNFENWAKQLLAFIDEVIGEPAFIICNSVGGLAGLQAAVDEPSKVRGVQLMNISLRLLHINNQPAWKKPFVKGVQTVFRDTPLGVFFFNQLAKKDAVKKILRQCYGNNKEAVSDELVQYLLDPGMQPGAARVFLDFISYSAGPLPRQLLDLVKVPVSILWGEKDPWEPVAGGKQLGEAASVEEFIVLPGLGHCPMDEDPEMVNPRMLDFIQRHAPAT